MEGINFFTLFLGTKNEHLSKDVGAIPYYLYKKHGYNSYIATYENEKGYKNLSKEINGVNLTFVKKTGFGEMFDGILFLVKNSLNVDILNLYHLSVKSALWAYMYKLTNKKGIIYLKTDASYATINKIKRSRLRRIIINKLLNLADVVSVESTPILNELKAVLENNYLLLPNGYFEDNNQDGIIRKEKIILFVGRVSAPEKNVDLLVNAFIHAGLDKDWKLVLVGPYSDEFYHKIEKICDQFGYKIGENVHFLGSITDRKILNSIYCKSAVFVLPSEYESYGIVLVEALRKGCYLIGSENIPSFDEIVDFGKYGTTIDINSISSFSNVLHDTAVAHIDDNDRIKCQIEYADNCFCWNTIIDVLNNRIQDALANVKDWEDD